MAKGLLKGHYAETTANEYLGPGTVVVVVLAPARFDRGALRTRPPAS